MKNQFKHILISLFLISFLASCYSNNYFKKSSKNDLWLSYNIQNLFDDKNVGTEYYDFNEKNWNTKLYQQKVLNLAKVFDEVIAKKGDLKLVCLQEVESQEALDSLQKKSEALSKLKYTKFAKDDKQAIGMALLSSYPIEENIKFDPSLFNTNTKRKDFSIRPIIYAKLQIKIGLSAHVFAVHLPSKRNGSKEKTATRLTILNFLNEKAKEILDKDPNAYIVIMGDFNDSQSEKTISSLQNAYQLSPDEKGSYLHRKKWQKIDQILLSSAFLDKANPLQIINFDVIEDKLLLRADKKSGKLKTFAFDKGYGYSDHLPVYVEITKN